MFSTLSGAIRRLSLALGVIAGAGTALLMLTVVPDLFSRSFLGEAVYGMAETGIFLLVLITFATLIVLYIKSLLRHMQFDKSHMTSLFENATEGIILTGREGKIVLVNPAAERIFGYTADELICKTIEVLIHEKFRHGN